MTQHGVLRLFTAVLPAPAVVADLEDAVDGARVTAPSVRWTDPSGWHLTTSFMGATDPARLEPLATGLNQHLTGLSPFQLRLIGTGAFPSVAAARQFWLGVDDPNNAMNGVMAACRRAARQAGVRADEAEHTTHLTLGRFRHPTDASFLAAQLARYESAPWTVRAICLVHSELGKGLEGRPRYHIVQRFALHGDASDTAHSIFG